MEKRTEWQGQNESQIEGGEKRNGRLVGVAETSKERAVAQASAEKLEHTGPAEKERVVSVPQREHLASMPEPPLPKGKRTEPSVQSTRS